MAEAQFGPALVSGGVDGRITIPLPWCKRLAWLTGSKTLLVWLLMYVPGRFRILSDDEVQRDTTLSSLRSVIMDGPSPTEVNPTEFDPNERAALLGRLIPTSLSLGESCRLIVPKQAAPSGRGREYILMFCQGYLELWFTEIYHEALAKPLDTIG